MNNSDTYLLVFYLVGAIIAIFLGAMVLLSERNIKK